MFVCDQDDHRYYRSRIATAEEQAMFWIDEKTMYAGSRHDTLSESYRSAAVSLHLAFLLLYRHFSFTAVRASVVANSVKYIHLSSFVHACRHAKLCTCMYVQQIFCSHKASIALI